MISVVLHRIASIHRVYLRIKPQILITKTSAQIILEYVLPYLRMYVLTQQDKIFRVGVDVVGAARMDVKKVFVSLLHVMSCHVQIEKKAADAGVVRSSTYA